MLLVQLVTGCNPPAQEQPAANVATAVVPRPAETADTKLIVAFGDSLYAGYQLPQDQGFAPVLERALAARGTKARVFNAGVSGDTSAAGLQRLAFVLDGLDHKPDLVVVGLGGNDMLRGLSPAETRANIDAILTELERRGIPAMLTGLQAAPNMGPDYARDFNALYPALAKKHGVPLYPFFLDGVITDRALLLDDGIHPNARGVETIVARVAPMVAERLAEQR